MPLGVNSEREAPQHRADEATVAKPLAAVQAHHQRFVRVALDAQHRASFRARDDLPVLAAAGLAEKECDGRFVALHLPDDFVHGCGPDFFRDGGAGFRERGGEVAVGRLRGDW